MTNQSAQEIQSAADVITDIADMMPVICLADSADCSASFLISSATTAKPFPFSPARAASILAFKESRFVTKTVFNSLNSEIGEVGNAVENIRVGVDKLNDVRDTVLSAVQSLAYINTIRRTNVSIYLTIHLKSVSY